MKPNGNRLIAYGKIRRGLSSVRPGASDRRECGTEGATSVFTALSTRLTLRLSALIILIHPSPLHPLRRTPAAHACHSVSTPPAVNPFPNALYKHIITKNGFICISKILSPKNRVQ